MNRKNRNAFLALAAMAAGIACMPVAALFNTVAGLLLASLSVYLIYLASPAAGANRPDRTKSA